ncbi:unnamed protein product [Pieris macdunnoughi]|uniref:Uncharacterized protein n=1 Tax=Pieris macdunnoughi TaxID=345717 RepID=A0A821Q771_9NEOP|nr:unnamed protein product [Pieris macdunnoughi]
MISIKTFRCRTSLLVAAANVTGPWPANGPARMVASPTASQFAPPIPVARPGVPHALAVENPPLGVQHRDTQHPVVDAQAALRILGGAILRSTKTVIVLGANGAIQQRHPRPRSPWTSQMLGGSIPISTQSTTI